MTEQKTATVRAEYAALPLEQLAAFVSYHRQESQVEVVMNVSPEAAQRHMEKLGIAETVLHERSEQARRMVEDVEDVPAVRTSSDDSGAARECRVRAMRAFFRTAQAEELETSPCAAERMRREISYALNRWIESRRQVATGEWIELQTRLLIDLAW